MLEVLGELVALHLRQNGDKALCRISHVGDEEQTRIQAPQVVHALEVVVSTTKHASSRVVIRVHHGDVRVRSDSQARGANSGVALLSFLRKVRIREFFTARQRCAMDLVAPDDLFLFGQDQFVPDLHHHLDLAHAHVGSTGSP